ncbi:Atxe2 family lasso peptide isopeptidase [Sphingopyxis indica]|uniref:Atxe2 family lasso peptide isopeptidase n=1 Tax=Sphingopyxis indica TaxID=436663 RepID=UPI0029395174|nr:Atxe2 family lasso peptide isopeptidase [Sphingopyxis indica]WOF45064.1 Atxe2 family lasso peptide isopeptidase [Sphingopyxis indica]
MTSEVGPHAFALSPDRQRVAFAIQEADPDSNSYQLRLVVMDLAGSTPITIDEGGDLIRRVVTGIGGVNLNTGFPATIAPVWSRDGRAVYFIKRTGKTSQIWRASSDGKMSEQLSHVQGDVEDLVLAEDGTRLIFSSRQPDPAMRDALTKEGSRGFHYDDRFMPLSASTPDAFPTNRKALLSIDIGTGAIEPASSGDAEYLSKASSLPAETSATQSEGRRAWIEQDGDQVLGRSSKLHADGVDGRPVLCAAAACGGAYQLWWTDSGKRVRYIRHQGWADSETAIFEWAPGQSDPVQLYSTPDLLLDCQPLRGNLMCAREKSNVPRQLIVLNLSSRRDKVLFDPNPDFSRFSLGKVERLHWTNDFGVETFGDLVYPVGYIPGQTYPLIVVQYISRGFLRGGVGDEFPIQLFSNHGYAVLSVQRPSATRLIPDAENRTELERRLLTDFKDRRSVLSSIELAVHALINRGIVDPERVGITGLSDGSSTVQYAAINSHLFKAGSVSGCCWDPFQDAFIGPAAATAFHEAGWPSLIDEQSAFWDRMSLIRNAPRVTFPLLMQQADDEFRGAVASYTALRQAGKPAALYVFPGEYHFKWQPAHRLAAYERNLRWFDFWLRGAEGPSEWDSFRDASAKSAEQVAQP